MSFFANFFVQIMKRFCGNFELFEILVQLILKKTQFLIMIYLYRPSDLAQTPGVTPPTPDEVRSFFY